MRWRLVSWLAAGFALILCAYAGNARDTAEKTVQTVEAGAFTWSETAPGFETAEMPVHSGNKQVDRILLTRIDPEKFRFIVRYAPGGGHEAGTWMKRLDAILVLNGSYYAKDGSPDTPLLAGKRLLGPPDYQATHGAFIVSPDFTGIRDLQGTGWRSAYLNAEDGMVSYPLLIATGGKIRFAASARKAKRSFIAMEKKSGSIILGTTKSDSFTLNELAVFLRDGPLQLEMALNLDGGPVACQKISFRQTSIEYCDGDSGGGNNATGAATNAQSLHLPIILAILPKKGKPPAQPR